MLYSGEISIGKSGWRKSGCIRAKRLYSGKSCFTRVKWLNLFGEKWGGQNCSISEELVVFGQKWLHLGKVVVAKKWLYSGKEVVFGQKLWLYSGKGCIKVVVFYSGKSGKIYSGKSGCSRAKLFYF